MSTEITTAFVRQFGGNVIHLVQQQGSRLRGAVRTENLVGESGYYERIGNVVAQKKTSRHADTVITDTPHSRRMVVGSTYNHADLIDNDDKLKMLIDPKSDYVQAFMWALGRAIDDEIIEAADGTASTGKLGTGTQAHSNLYKLGSVNAAGNAVAKMNVELLRRLKKKLDGFEVEDMERYIAFDANQAENLLSETEITSSDYNSVKALVRGEVNTFLGFNFIRTERLLLNSGTLNYSYTDGSVGAGSGDADGHTRCIAWQKKGLLLAVNQEPFAKIAERPDKNHSTQAYVEMTVGAVRMEEERVLIGLSDT
jgi:hypothetical protein